MINLHLTKITKLFDLENLELYDIIITPIADNIIMWYLAIDIYITDNENLRKGMYFTS